MRTQIYLADGLCKVLATLCIPADGPLKPDTIKTWEVATTWITDCVVNHPGCTHAPTESSHRPSRLVAVGLRDDFSDIHLCMNSEIEPDSQYATLSHSWGRNGLSMKLTKSLEQDYTKQIPWDSLPQTFKDAIKVTRKLRAAFGVQFLWIDALCILQDSTDDWRKEAGNMSDIYYFSFCNLAACLASDSHGGLFCDRDPLSFHTCVVQARIDDSPRSFFEIENHCSLSTEIQNSDLESRAWVLQEMLLAQRILYFAPQKLFWECGKLCAHEGAANRALSGYPIKERGLNSLRGVSETPDSEGADYRLYRIWMNMVNLYTKRHLTKSSDKLVAISGLAKLIAARLVNQDVYIVGLWKHNLLLHMLWRISSHAQVSRPKPYRAPSWSWASVEGTMYNHRTNREAVENTSALAKIQDLQVDYEVIEDPFGQVKSAEMLIQGRLIRVELEFLTSSPNPLTELKWQGNPITEIGTDLTRLDFEMSTDTRPPLAYCLPLIDEKYYSPRESPRHWVTLLLRPVEGSPGTYERFGLSDMTEKARDAFRQAESLELSEKEYLESHGKGIYTIRIR